MKENQASSDKYISLKQAAEISGYSSDYIGQLIRKGKLPGKQVYHAVAWTTTEEALQEYLKRERARKGKTDLSQKAVEQFRLARIKFLESPQWIRAVRLIVYVILILLVVFLMLLIHLFFVGFEHKLDQRAIENIQPTRSYEASQ